MDPTLLISTVPSLNGSGSFIDKKARSAFIDAPMFVLAPWTVKLYFSSSSHRLKVAFSNVVLADMARAETLAPGTSFCIAPVIDWASWLELDESRTALNAGRLVRFSSRFRPRLTTTEPRFTPTLALEGYC